MVGDVRDIYVVSRGRQIFVFFVGEDVDGDKVDFGVIVFVSFGGRYVDDFVGVVFDDDEIVFVQSRVLYGEGQ